MVDFGYVWKNGFADLAIINNELATGSELETNLLVSLFTDARSQDLSKPDRRGYWGDQSLGSKLWEFFREPATPENLQRVIDICKKSTQWIIDEGIASSISVSGLIFNRNGFYIEMDISRGTNKKYDYLWNGVSDRKYDFEDNSIFLKYQV